MFRFILVLNFGADGQTDGGFVSSVKRERGNPRQSENRTKRRNPGNEATTMMSSMGATATMTTVDRAFGRMTAETINGSERGYNPCDEYELRLRGLGIAAIENLAATRNQYDCIDLNDNEIVKVENFPRLPRLKTLMLANNRVARVNGEELARACPALRRLVLTNNGLRNLADCDGLSACPRLEMLSLMENPVSTKENYRLYVIYKCKALKVLDFQKVKPAERELAMKTFGADDGAAARAKTFTPGEVPGEATAENEEEEKKDEKPSGPTPEQMMALKVAIANAETLDEVARLENALATGVLPSDLQL